MNTDGKENHDANNEKPVSDEEAALLCPLAINGENPFTDRVGSKVSSTAMIPPQKPEQQIFHDLHLK